MSHVWLYNEETDAVWACPADVVEVAQRRGWVQCDAPADDESHLKDPQPPAPAPGEEAPVETPEPVKPQHAAKSTKEK